MTHRFIASASATASIIAALIALGTAGAAGQTPAATGKTVDGQPDLQGKWNYSTITPYERPPEFAGKATFTNEEAAAFERAIMANSNRDRRDEEDGGGGNRIVNGTVETDDLARAYNDFWWDSGTRMSKTNRTSLVVDPPDGRVPALTPEAQKRMAARREMEARPAWGPEDRPVGERCIHQQKAGPPIVPGGYNNNLQILQTPGYVAIVTEQIHEARIIPMDGRPHVAAAIRGWKGDSRGRWEGKTLVVETANFKDRDAASFRGSSPDMRLTERFSRLDADTILYEYTVDDPAAFAKPWTVRTTMTRFNEPMYEFACHEGNYGIVGTLSGARFVEKNNAAK